MKKAIPYWQMVGFVFTAVAGTLLHFLFDWTGGSVFAALFSAVNESVWEHLKLLFYPMLAVAAAEYFCFGKEEGAFWCIKLLGVMVGVMLIVAVYYTYTGALGIKVDWLNISLFFLAAAGAYWMETKWFQRCFPCGISAFWAVMMIGLLAALFTVFTFFPPRLPLFQDPVTGGYGYFG